MNRTIHLTLSAADIREKDLTGRIAVVIDVLRATSVIVTALSNGASWVKTVASIEEAFQLKKTGILLGGERHALPINGFDCSNSPLEYTTERVLNQGIVLTTTNGTQAISRCHNAAEVLIGSFLNHQALATYLIKKVMPVELICAGTNNEFSLDDFLCASLICSSLEKSGKFKFDDLGKLAIEKWEQSQSDIHSALQDTTHYNVLKSKGLISDLDYCLQMDTHNIVVSGDSSNFFTKKT